MVSLAFADDTIADRYSESGNPGCNYWKPENLRMKAGLAYPSMKLMTAQFFGGAT
ncbi:hypothetical protein D3C86_1663050 [compost metagenome]